jgi:hypothetical protein
VPEQFEAGLGQQIVHIVPGTRKEIVHREDVVAKLEQTSAQMGPDEAGTAGNQDFHE